MKNNDWRTVSLSVIAGLASLEIFRFLPEDTNLALLLSLLLACGVALDYLIRVKRREKIRAAWITEPVWVADFGPFGGSAYSRIPEHLSKCPIIFCPASAVRQREADIIGELVRADNKYFTDPDLDASERLPVNVRFWRDPETGNVNETGEAYLSALFADIENARQEYLTTLRKNSPAEDYEALFFETHRMY